MRQRPSVAARNHTRQYQGKVGLSDLFKSLPARQLCAITGQGAGMNHTTKDSAVLHSPDAVDPRPGLRAVPDASGWLPPSPLSENVARTPFPVKSLPPIVRDIAEGTADNLAYVPLTSLL